MRRDFRTDAAAATLSRLISLGNHSVADLDESGCVLVPDGTRLRYLTEVPSLLIIIGCWLSLVAALVLGMLRVFSERQVLVVMLGGLVVSLVFRKLRSQALRWLLAGRRDSLVKAFPQLPSRAVAIEEARTVQKVKFLTEDEGVCLLDAPRQRLLIEGCSYRHVVYAKDVLSVESVSGYALSGARLVCRMGGQQLDMVLKAAGQGPLASLVQAFAPAEQAKGLATILNQTLFGTDAAVYQQKKLPPPLPRA